jgi:hypothetical protein
MLTDVINTILIGIVCLAFFTDYPLNGLNIVAQAILGQFVSYCGSDDTETCTLHILDILLIALKFSFDFASIVIGYDAR